MNSAGLGDSARTPTNAIINYSFSVNYSTGAFGSEIRGNIPRSERPAQCVSFRPSQRISKPFNAFRQNLYNYHERNSDWEWRRMRRASLAYVL